MLASCETFVEVEAPKDRLISETLFQNDGTAISAMTGLYANMMRNDQVLSYIIPYQTGLYGDELDYKQNNPLLQGVYKNAMTARDAVTNTFWTNSYNFIYQANSILEGLQNSNSLSEPVKKQLSGEALFLRAFWHFYLLNFYGDIPIVTTTDYTINARLPRSAKASVFEQIEKDLLQSKILLSAKYVAANSVSEASNRVRPNTYASATLLARVYLHQKKYKNAVEEATYIIESGLYSIENIDRVFKRNSKEAILQLETSSMAVPNSYEAFYFTLTTLPGPTSNLRSATISPLLYNLFTSNDQRKGRWFSKYTTQNVDYLFPSKYKSTTTSVLDEFTTVFRLGEVYLIRAESYAELNKTELAILDADRIRLRAGIDLLKDTSPGMSKEELLTAIALERRKELFCEWGIRLMDILRSDKAHEIMTATALQKGETWQHTMALWPIPINDIINNNKIIQNAGYN